MFQRILGPVGMKFIPNIGGISHSPKEVRLPGTSKTGEHTVADGLEVLTPKVKRKLSGG